MIIHNIYILDTYGIPIVTRIYGEIKVDPTLISGYISAQNSFFKEITGQDLEMFSTKDYNFWLRKVGRFLIVIVSSKDVDPKIMRWKLSQIQLAFIMNLEKDSLNTIIDSVALNSLKFVLDKTKLEDLAHIIKHLLLNNTIIVLGERRDDVCKYIYTILALSPIFKETYFYEYKEIFLEGSIIGSTKFEIKNILKNRSAVYYDLERKIIEYNNLSDSLNKRVLNTFITELLSKCKLMEETAAIDFIRNTLRRIIRIKNNVKELINQRRKIMFEDVLNSLKISNKELPAVLEILQNELSRLIIKDNVIYYQD